MTSPAEHAATENEKRAREMLRERMAQLVLDSERARADELERERDELGNALVRERAKPEGSFDQWDRLQRAEAALREIATAPDWCGRKARAALAADRTEEPCEWFVPEGDQQCGVIHTEAHAVCMARKGHDGPHRNTQGTWIDGPWCKYPADRIEEGEA